MTKVVTIFGNVTDKCNIGQPINLPPLPVPRGLPIQSATFATRQRQITKVLPTTLPVSATATTRALDHAGATVGSLAVERGHLGATAG